MHNRQWLIARRPIGRALEAEDFLWAEGTAPAPGPGEVLVRVDWLSFDPAQKGWMENVADYVAPSAIGDPVPAFACGEVVASADPAFAPGDKVTGRLSWQDYACVPAAALSRLPDDGHGSRNLGVLGITGMTAFFGLHRVGRPVAGDTMVVTGAAGATGSLVGQLGKIAGCRVIGLAGGADKCRWLTGEMGFDAAVDYRAPDARQQVKALVPQGIDVLWDNVGGPLLDTLLPRIATGARVVICGAISTYSSATRGAGPANYMQLVFRRARMEGFIALDYAAEYPMARARLAQWLAEGRITAQEDVAQGLEQAPQTLMRLFAGANRGKQVLQMR
ncbi:MAG TPA: NADP-dependent oxidoreductase [Novosphingobium sp.]|nr:NADP-dependent oxidoreductase [Novosphingobium sp.]HZV09312.1 NADP-dependent oxidoreductase [Novosphingobium sp.]